MSIRRIAWKLCHFDYALSSYLVDNFKKNARLIIKGITCDDLINAYIPETYRDLARAVKDNTRKSSSTDNSFLIDAGHIEGIGDKQIYIGAYTAKNIITPLCNPEYSPISEDACPIAAEKMRDATSEYIELSFQYGLLREVINTLSGYMTPSQLLAVWPALSGILDSTICYMPKERQETFRRAMQVRPGAAPLIGPDVRKNIREVTHLLTVIEMLPENVEAPEVELQIRNKYFFEKDGGAFKYRPIA